MGKERKNTRRRSGRKGKQSPQKVSCKRRKFGRKVRCKCENVRCKRQKFGESTDAPKNIGKTAQKIIDFVISVPPMSAETMAYKIGISSRAVEKQIAKLRSMGILSREGADFGGYWRIVINPQTEK